jgi:hypothetical protein
MQKGSLGSLFSWIWRKKSEQKKKLKKCQFFLTPEKSEKLLADKLLSA